jgi:hypothetical protein
MLLCAVLSVGYAGMLLLLLMAIHTRQWEASVLKKQWLYCRSSTSPATPQVLPRCFPTLVLLSEYYSCLTTAENHVQHFLLIFLLSLPCETI